MTHDSRLELGASSFSNPYLVLGYRLSSMQFPRVLLEGRDSAADQQHPADGQEVAQRHAEPGPPSHCRKPSGLETGAKECIV